MKESTTLTDHDLLIRIDERMTETRSDVADLKKWSENHDKTHRRTLKVLGSISAGVAAIVGFFTSLVSK